ncbi:hypothetical protein PIB30_044910 [Stylosanthes scabra]|uniref:Uncharacterized protein n=1 Tax=Stylosanthes scabra TaxID=79078 RepID=A0ABU6WFV8_9FABA|nr:hypothetical protein [Stylosanthes scabra]
MERGLKIPQSERIKTTTLCFYQAFGEKAYIRSAEDIAYNVALFIAKKGSYVNYYMLLREDG